MLICPANPLSPPCKTGEPSTGENAHDTPCVIHNMASVDFTKTIILIYVAITAIPLISIIHNLNRLTKLLLTNQ